MKGKRNEPEVFTPEVQLAIIEEARRKRFERAHYGMPQSDQDDEGELLDVRNVGMGGTVQQADDYAKRYPTP